MTRVDRAVAWCVGYVRYGYKKATSYLSDELVVKATALHQRRANGRQFTVVVTIGAPNYAERQFIKACKKAGKPLPIKKVQLRDWPTLCRVAQSR